MPNNARTRDALERATAEPIKSSHPRIACSGSAQSSTRSLVTGRPNPAKPPQDIGGGLGDFTTALRNDRDMTFTNVVVVRNKSPILDRFTCGEIVDVTGIIF